jgi:hypothetical protein
LPSCSWFLRADGAVGRAAVVLRDQPVPARHREGLKVKDGHGEVIIHTCNVRHPFRVDGKDPVWRRVEALGRCVAA